MRKRDHESYYMTSQRWQLSMDKKAVDRLRKYKSIVIIIAIWLVIIAWLLFKIFIRNEDVGFNYLLWLSAFGYISINIVMRVPWISQFIVRIMLNPFLVLLIFVGGGILLALAVILFLDAFQIWRNGLDFKNSYDLLQPLIWSIGGVGAAIGLCFATQRQVTFSAQVQGEIDQNFNERLGRGVELLAKDNMVMRSAGTSILVDLADNATEAQKPLVANIIYNFLLDNAKIKYNKDGKRRPILEEESRQDVQSALDFLIDLSLDEREKLLPKRLFSRGRLILHSLDFSYLDFTSKKIEKIDFTDSYFYEITFEKGTIIKHANFSHAKIASALFSKIEIRNSSFANGEIIGLRLYHSTIKNSNFSGAKIEETSFVGVEIVDSEFGDAQFIGGEFSGKIKLSSKNNLPKFICTEFWGAVFDSPDEIYSDDIFKSCYCHEYLRLPFLNESEKYEFKMDDRGKVFVKGSSWPGESVRKRVLVEITEHKLKNTKFFLQSAEHFDASDERVRKLRDEEEYLEEKLSAAKIDLENDTNKHNP